MEASSIAPTRPGLRGSLLPLARLSDQALARLVRRGDDAAFSAIYTRYHGPLYRYCRTIVREESDAQDALQSTFTAALNALRGRELDAPLRPWLYRIAHNESVSLLRRRRPFTELPGELAAREASVEDGAVEHERFSTLLSDLQELPERQRAALIMRELNDLSHEEIAQALETTVGTAKQTIFEARRSLADFEAGRGMPCDDVCRVVSEGDRRMLRSRRVSSHLRACGACTAFAAGIERRTADLRALTPVLPAGAAAGLLSHVLHGAGAGGSGLATGGGGATALSGAGVKGVAGLSALKLPAGAVLLATATAGAVSVVDHSARPAQVPASARRSAPVGSRAARDPRAPALPAPAGHSSGAVVARAVRPGAGQPVTAATRAAGNGAAPARPRATRTTPSSAAPTPAAFVPIVASPTASVQPSTAAPAAGPGHAQARRGDGLLPPGLGGRPANRGQSRSSTRVPDRVGAGRQAGSSTSTARGDSAGTGSRPQPGRGSGTAGPHRGRSPSSRGQENGSTGPGTGSGRGAPSSGDGTSAGANAVRSGASTVPADGNAPPASRTGTTGNGGPKGRELAGSPPSRVPGAVVTSPGAHPRGG